MASSDMRVDRLPPHSIENEQGVLGCILLSPQECLTQYTEKVGDTSDIFYDLRHQTIIDRLLVMYDQRIPIDLISLQQNLKDWGLLDEVGGIPYLNTLQDSVPSASNLTYYLDVVIEKSWLRKAIGTCTDFVGRVYDFQGELPQLVDEFESSVMRLTQQRDQASSVPIGDLVMGAMNALESYYNRQGAPGAVATGYLDLDRILLGGLKQGEMMILAARPSMGKTSLLMNMMENIATVQRLPVGIFSLEMTKEALTMRMICSRSRVNLSNATDGFLSERDFPRLTAAAGTIRNAPIYIDDTPALSILQLRAKARRMMQQYGIKVLGVDYLQLMHSTSKRARENRQLEVSEISSGLKALAKELNIPIVVLSQLNRGIEQGGARKPRLSDLRESGSLEQDADVVGMLYKPEGEPEEEADNQSREAIRVNLLIAKQRNGPTGDIWLTFLKPYTRFESTTRVSTEDMPAPREQQPELGQGSLPPSDS